MDTNTLSHINLKVVEWASRIVAVVVDTADKFIVESDKKKLIL